MLGAVPRCLGQHCGLNCTVEVYFHCFSPVISHSLSEIFCLYWGKSACMLVLRILDTLEYLLACVCILFMFMCVVNLISVCAGGLWHGLPGAEAIPPQRPGCS